MKLCRYCQNRGKKEQCQYYSEVSNHAEICNDYMQAEGLEDWLENRGKPINEEALKQAYRNKVSAAQGQHFELEILAACNYYRHKGVAVIDKTPEPFRVTKKGANGVFTGRFTKAAQPDFQGTLINGTSIVFEAKMTSKDRINRDVLTEEQMNTLEAHQNLSAKCYVCACIQNQCFMIPWEIWRDMKTHYGRKYIKAEDVEEYKVKYDGKVHFLQRILPELGVKA